MWMFALLNVHVVLKAVVKLTSWLCVIGNSGLSFLGVGTCLKCLTQWYQLLFLILISLLQ